MDKGKQGEDDRKDEGRKGKQVRKQGWMEEGRKEGRKNIGNGRRVGEWDDQRWKRR